MPGPTTIPFGDPKAAKKWSGSLFIDTVKKSYWEQRFVGESDNHIIQRLTDLESEQGDTINYDLSVQLRNEPTYGDNRLAGKEEKLKFFSDDVVIDQMRHGVSAGGKMSRKRTVHNIRKVARDRLSDYWSKTMDEIVFIYLSGSRGINPDFTFPLTWVGHATNPLTAPDSAHQLYGGTATSKAGLTNADIMSRSTVERAATKAKMMRAVDPTKATLLPTMINGQPHYCMVMSPFQTHSMRTADAAGWLDIQKAAAAAEGKANPIFKGGLGMINNVVLHDHENVIRFSDYGSGANLAAARALFMGRQAGVIAYGTKGGKRFDWTEEAEDRGNEQVISGGLIVGIKKATFNSSDFGVCAVDTYAADPNAA